MSVPNLAPENVTVVDMSGRILSEKLDTGNESSVGLSVSQLELKRSFEEEIEGRLLQMLERVFGPGKVVAMISADLNFDHSTVTKIVYDSDNAVLRSEHVIRESSQGGNSGGGPPGTDSNIPVYPEEGDENDYTYERDEHTKNWEIGSSETTVVTAPGRVQRLSAAVTVSSELTLEEKAELETMVAGAMGIDLPRGDRVTVSGISFNTDHLGDINDDLESIHRKEMLQQYLNYGFKGFGLVLGFVLILVFGIRLLRPSARTEEYVPVTPPFTAVAAINEAAAAKEETEMDYIRNLINTKPGEVAEVLRAWSHEE